MRFSGSFLFNVTNMHDFKSTHKLMYLLPECEFKIHKVKLENYSCCMMDLFDFTIVDDNEWNMQYRMSACVVSKQMFEFHWIITAEEFLKAAL